MKVLRILRHAKSDWDSPFSDDLERGLNRRGIKDVSLIGPYIYSLIAQSNLILVSPAQRTQLTINGILSLMDSADSRVGDVYIDSAIYTFSSDDLLAVLTSQKNEVNDLCLVGHNPAVTELITYLTCEQLNNFPTCGYFEMKLAIDNWQQISKGCGTRRTYLTPKMIKKGRVIN